MPAVQKSAGASEVYTMKQDTNAEVIKRVDERFHNKDCQLCGFRPPHCPGGRYCQHCINYMVDNPDFVPPAHDEKVKPEIRQEVLF